MIDSGSSRSDATWWLRCIVHNVAIHPFLPFADALEAFVGVNAVSTLVYRLHDATVPHGGG